MSIKSGYKQTEIGIIPEDWEVVELDNILEKFQNGYAFSSEGYVETGVPIISMANISLKGTFQFDYEKAKYWAEEELDNLKQYQLEKGDLIIAMTDVTPDKKLIGRMAIVDKNDTFLLNQRVGLLKLKEVINNKFLCEYGNFDIWRKYSKNVAALGAQANISTKDIKNGKIPLPPLEEQKKIADILSTVDKKIAFVEENINATEELKKGLMQKLLTEGIGHTEFKDSEIGRIPKSWEVKSIGSLTSLTAGGTPSTQIKDYWNPKEVPWLSSGEVNKKIIYFTDNMISKQGLNNSAAKFIPKYSVLIALAGQGKTRGTVAISEIELTTNQSVASILPSEKLDMYFIYYNLDSRYEEIRSMSTGVGGRGGLNLAILKSIKIALPPQKEQKQISEILSTVDKKLENLKEKKLFFQELKKGLMQKLLTGEVRV
ncbi:restriction endonuclease subunit S [Aliarcobacter butzleri]|uniref:restriction endonuclease subunit S n=1 Tax=Aliarcobacter butzleri TaxID=28197 RepID=UPI0021B36A04|nr:restriction endonuclease subunit S [Aliarcobacter butzleri]MCT7557246.1 restriction endonuclease subunit S [Aliarcobacter butzleri]MCT7575637.1 restriction endonuclease subunit S [Aliarcobacter butzleri]